MQQPRTPEKYRCPLTQAKDLGGGYFLITMTSPPNYSFLPGQHISIYFEDEAGVFERFYSIANAPNVKRELQFCIVMVEERVTKVLKTLKVGDSLEISQARGSFTLRSDKGPAVLIAGGSGISPIRGFFQQLTHNFAAPPKEKLHLIYGCKIADYIPGKEEFLEYQAKHGKNLGLWITAEQGQCPGVMYGSVLEHFAAAILENADYYLCGPFGMIEAAKKKLGELGVRQDRIFRELY